jgi:Ion channel
MLANSNILNSPGNAARPPQQFTLLLAGLFLFFMMAPLSWLIRIYLDSEIGTALLVSVLSIDILLAALIASDRRRDRAIAFLLAGPSVAAYVVCLIAGNNLLWGVAHVLGIVFLGHSLIVVARFVFTETRVTWNTVSAALCIYLLFGIAYGLFYCLLFVLDPDSFAFSTVDQAPEIFDSQSLISGIYYSLITMTTLGYGDIVPTTPVTRMAAGVQALLGQLYVAVLVARLVGMQVADSMGDRDK